MKRRVLVIRNPAAGAPRDRGPRAAALVAGLRADGHEVSVHETAGPGEAAERVSREGGLWDAVVSAGGDGTANDVANGLIRGRHRTPMAVAPLGTGNDYAQLLGTAALKDAVRAVGMGIPRSVDTLEVMPLAGREGASRHALLFCGCGLATSLLERTTPRVKRIFGRRGSYSAGFLRALWSHQPRQFRIRTESESWQSARGTVFVAAKASHAGGGSLHLAPGARLDDGLLYGLWLGTATRGSILGHFLRLSRGTHEGHPDLRCFTGSWVEVDADPSMPLAVDGEVMGTTPIRIQVRRASLNVLTTDFRSMR